MEIHIMLRDLIRSELLNNKLHEITPEVAENLSKEIIETFMWCLYRGERELCISYKKIVDTFLEAYPVLRLLKYVGMRASSESLTSVDKEVLSASLKMVRKYFEALVKGVITHDGTVPVIVKKDLLLNGRVVPKGALTLINIGKALALEAASYVNILIPK
ncbi:MAG: hypothetical protein J7J11_01505 [Desulfurococcales archaeon]|nr:hypothetical protein [Desulfurococcales archaeon]